MDLQLFNFVNNLRCPVSGAGLKVLSGAELNFLNDAILAGKVYTKSGSLQTEPLAEGLISADGKYAYAVFDGYLASLLATDALLASEFVSPGSGVEYSDEDKQNAALAEGKKVVQKFYDEYGWQKTDKGYKDTLTFEDQRPVSESYWSRCHLRLNKYLPGGRYILDVASGSIPNDEYLTYSDLYEARVCMDFSIQALKEAFIRLKGKGIFILGDMANMPIMDGCIDSVISMHTVYHIPQQEQAKAIGEAERVLVKGGRAVIVYSWCNPAFMKAAFGFYKPLLGVYKKLKKRKKTLKFSGDNRRPQLFVQQQDYHWFSNHIGSAYNARLKVYSSISRSFSNTFIKEKAFGRQFASFIFLLEENFPRLMGRFGQYPVFLIEKVRITTKKQADVAGLPLPGYGQKTEGVPA